MDGSPGKWIRFDPPHRKGYLLNLAALLVDFFLIAALLVFSLGQPPGLIVVVVLLGALLLSVPLPILMYRLYSLWRSGYWVGRDGVRLRWGLRLVDLPYDEIIDVASADELEHPIGFPRWTWPGSVVGQLVDSELGPVEFLASDTRRLVLIGTKKLVFAVSPQEQGEFIEAYKHESERGSLRPLAAYSVQPIFVLVEAWAELQSRRLLVAGGVMAMVLLLLVGVLAPNLETATLGFAADGQPLPAVAGVQLFLLPALNLFFYMGNFILGLLFYREPHGALISHLLWGGSLLTSLVYIGGVLFSL
ncbi:MAG TPA: PH domain-containing protein [Anaerolineales bacterium]|nr:PH domain-containing protein [Anaerolineales bacterium]